MKEYNCYSQLCPRINLIVKTNSEKEHEIKQQFNKQMNKMNEFIIKCVDKKIKDMQEKGEHTGFNNSEIQSIYEMLNELKDYSFVKIDEVE
jgi:hypothetical protein